MNYSIINVKCRNTLQGVRLIQEENKRARTYGDINEEKSQLNEYKDYKDFYKLYKKAMKHDYYTKPDNYGRTHKEPKTKCIDLMMTFSPEMKEKIDVRKWYEKNKQFLKEYFAGCEISIVLHQDQTTPHIHAQILPVITKEAIEKKNKGKTKDIGKISKTFFINGYKDMYKLHDEYAKAMNEFGLQRGKQTTRNEKEHLTKKQNSKYQEILERYETKEQEQELQQQFLNYQMETHKKETEEIEMRQRENRELKAKNTDLKTENRELEDKNRTAKIKLLEYAENIKQIIINSSYYQKLLKAFKKVEREYYLNEEMKRIIEVFKNEKIYLKRIDKNIDVEETLKKYLIYKKCALDIYDKYKEYVKEVCETEELFDKELKPLTVSDINNALKDYEEQEEDDIEL